MDTKTKIYHAQLILSGIGKPINFEGTITRIYLDSMTHLINTNPRDTIKGKEIILRISDKPYSSDKASRDFERVLEVESQIETPEMDTGPSENESYELYYERLIESGYDNASAIFLACDWFGLSQNDKLTQWIEDSKAKRFRELCTSQKAFEDSSPTEYQTLYYYCLAHYPEFLDNMTLRKA